MWIGMTELRQSLGVAGPPSSNAIAKRAIDTLVRAWSTGADPGSADKTYKARIITAGIAQAAKFFEQPDQRQPFPCRLALVRRQQPVKLGTPGGHLRKRLRLSLVPELRRLGTDDLAH